MGCALSNKNKNKVQKSDKTFKQIENPKLDAHFESV